MPRLKLRKEQCENCQGYFPASQMRVTRGQLLCNDCREKLPPYKRPNLSGVDWDDSKQSYNVYGREYQKRSDVRERRNTNRRANTAQKRIEKRTKGE